jgi:hypothetical protein
MVNKPGVAYTFNPKYSGGIGRRIVVQGWPWAKTQDPIKKK